MKKYYGPIVLGLASLMLVSPVINSVNVQAATDNNAVTQGTNYEGYNALQAQYRRLESEMNSGKYDQAQQLTLDTLESKYMHKEWTASDDQEQQYAQEIKDYLDRGVVGYPVQPWVETSAHNINEDEYIVPDFITVYTFKERNVPEIQHFVVKGHTIVDQNGNPSDGNIKAWLDNDDKLHIDSKYLVNVGGADYLRVVKNGEVAHISNSNKWISKVQDIYTNNHISFLYRLDGTRISDRALGPNSAWYSDRYATINGQTMYRVATDEWVRAADVH